jgi:sugar/nucleoside kinase (ribokinase family)
LIEDAQHGPGGAGARDAAVDAAARELAAGGALGASAPSVDAVGAGDSFDAGLIRALLDGLGSHEALTFACACGTLSTRAAGGTGSQATHEEAVALVRSWGA